MSLYNEGAIRRLTDDVKSIEGELSQQLLLDQSQNARIEKLEQQVAMLVAILKAKGEFPPPDVQA